MDGSDVKRIIYPNDIYWPNALAVDYATQRLFYADAKTWIIGSTDFGEM